MKRSIILALVLAIMTMGMGAYAMPLGINNTHLTTAAVNAIDGSTYDLDTNEFQLLGDDGQGSYLIYYDNQFLKVDSATMLPVIEALGENVEIPSMAGMRTLNRGNRGEDVTELQNALIKLGYLYGTADGDYGGMSENAISEAQEALGLEETGEADPMLQLLLESMAQPKRYCYVTEYTGSQFDPIIGKTEANLDKPIELRFNLDYDDIYGTGRITNGSIVSYTVPTESDIDMRSFELRFGLALDLENDLIVVAPVLDLTSVGAQRPGMQEIALKSGDARYTLPVTGLENSLSGLNAVEKAAISLDDDVVEMLANAADEGELKVRIVCKYDSYDITVDADKLPKIAEMAQAAQALYQ